MEVLKKIFKSIIFPHITFVLIIFPLSIGLMICSMLFLGMDSIFTYITYALAFYSLSVFCLKIPQIIEIIKKFKRENKYYLRYQNDVHLKIKISLYGSFILNVAYSIFQLCLGLCHKSFWFLSMAVYYILLSTIRFYLVSHTKKYKPGEQRLTEYKRYNFCGWLMLLMNLAVSIILFFIIYFGRTFYHHQITTIALAAYTFLTFSLSIYNFVKYRKLNNPVYSAAKTINLIAACVSMMIECSTEINNKE